MKENFQTNFEQNENQNEKKEKINRAQKAIEECLARDDNFKKCAQNLG